MKQADLVTRHGWRGGCLPRPLPCRTAAHSDLPELPAYEAPAPTKITKRVGVSFDEWLVDCAARERGGGGNPDRALKRYRRRHRSALAGHDYLISDYATGRAFNPIERLMYSATARDPVSARRFALFGERSISVRQFLSPRAIARALWVNATYRRHGSAVGRPVPHGA